MGYLMITVQLVLDAAYTFHIFRAANNDDDNDSSRDS